MALGWPVYGLGVMAMAAVCLAWGAFDPGQPVPKAFPDRTALAYVAAMFVLVAGAAVECRRMAAWGAGALAAYYALVVVILLNGRVVLANPTTYVAYSGAAEQLAIAAGGLIVFAAGARIDEPLAARLTLAGRLVFGVCALIFGGAHFVYLNFTIPFVPSWLPPSPAFWAYVTGIAHIAAGVALLTGVQARLAAILLTVMYASFTPLVHIPRLLADPSSFENWTENALNLALAGVAWVVADSLAPPRRQPEPAHSA
ncbi:MAG TPA: DoxX family protein [Caulobacteraceae bacterium]|nr:DoxX family protein [Caulobacteraceae bacterium]